MTDTTNFHAGALADAARDEATAALAPYIERRDALVAGAQKAFVTDEDSTGRAADLIKLTRSLGARCEAAIDGVREPYDLAVDAVRGVADKFIEPLHNAIESTNGKIEQFRKDERERVRQQKAEQRAAQDAARARAAAERAQENPAGIGEPIASSPPFVMQGAPAVEEPVALPSVRGDYGSLVTDKAKATFTIVDVRALPDSVLKAPGVEKAMLTAIRALHRLDPNISGVVVGGAVSSQTRS